jgi:hypothetical protein
LENSLLFIKDLHFFYNDTTLRGILEDHIAGNVVDTITELEVAQDILLEHMRDSYGTYRDTGRIHPNALHTLMALL